MGRQTQARIMGARIASGGGAAALHVLLFPRQQRAPPLVRANRSRGSACCSSCQRFSFLFMSLSQQKARKTRLLRRRGLFYHTVPYRDHCANLLGPSSLINYAPVMRKYLCCHVVTSKLGVHEHENSISLGVGRVFVDTRLPHPLHAHARVAA
jgi:hypothetical protein